MSRARRLASIATLLVASACSASDDDAASAESAQTESRDHGPALFRDDFYSYMVALRAGADEAKLAAEVQTLVYLPTDAVMKPRVEGSPAGAEARLYAYDEAFTKILPSSLFENGAPEKNALEDKKAKKLESVLREHRPHIVIVPGIFSEFIPRTPFEELFSADTAARRAFAVDGAKVKDERLVVGATKWDEAKQRYAPTLASVPLTGTQPSGEDALVRVASLDDEDGEALVTVAYLKANLGSLEDFGTLEEDSDTYLRRLDRYFEAVGIPESLYLMGYSRGAVTGLDLLVRAKAAGKPWAAKVKGFISHAGVIYGSQLADASFTEGPGTELVNVLRAFVGDEKTSVKVGGRDVEVLNLKSCKDPDIAAGAYNKALAWPGFLGLAGLVSSRNPKHPELGFEGIDSNLPDMGRLSSFIALALGIPLPGVQLDASRAVVDLKLFDTNHCENVERFKVTARAILAGAESLTTKARVDWWKANAVPSDVKYFALTGTMGDASREGDVWSNTKNPLAYDEGSIDLRSLRGNYYDFLKASGGIQLQDSQVSVERGRFWPELHGPGGFSAAQRGSLQTYFMGTVGTHHWGLAFPRAFSTEDGRDCPALGVEQEPFESCGNPYPRTLLLKTIATFVSQVALGKK